jgi:hypothetical protein
MRYWSTCRWIRSASTCLVLSQTCTATLKPKVSAFLLSTAILPRWRIPEDFPLKNLLGFFPILGSMSESPPEHDPLLLGQLVPWDSLRSQLGMKRLSDRPE